MTLKKTRYCRRNILGGFAIAMSFMNRSIEFWIRNVSPQKCVIDEERGKKFFLDYSYEHSFK